MAAAAVETIEHSSSRRGPLNSLTSIVKRNPRCPSHCAHIALLFGFPLGSASAAGVHPRGDGMVLSRADQQALPLLFGRNGDFLLCPQRLLSTRSISLLSCARVYATT